MSGLGKLVRKMIGARSSSGAVGSAEGSHSEMGVIHGGGLLEVSHPACSVSSRRQWSEAAGEEQLSGNR